MRGLGVAKVESKVLRKMYDGGGALLWRGSKPLTTVRDVWMLSGWMGRYM